MLPHATGREREKGLTASSDHRVLRANQVLTAIKSDELQLVRANLFHIRLCREDCSEPGQIVEPEFGRTIDFRVRKAGQRISNDMTLYVSANMLFDLGQ